MDIFKSIFQNIAVSYCLFTTALLIWGLDKGFDLSDEGYYLMCLTFPSEYFAANQWGNSIVGQVFGWMNPGIIFYRVIRLILTATSSLYLAHHLNLFIKEQVVKQANYVNFFVVFATVFSGAVLSYSIYPASISYNSLSVILLQFIVGKIVYIINTEDNNKTIFNLSLVGTGILLMMLFVAKISTGLFMALIVFAGINYRRILCKSSYRETIMDLLFLTTGGVIVAIILSVIDVPIFSRFELILEEVKFRTGEKIANHIYGYYTSISSSLAQVRNQIFWAPPLLFCLGALSRWKGNQFVFVLQISLVILVFLYIIYLAITENYFDNTYTMLNPYIMMLLSTVALCAGVSILGAQRLKLSHSKTKTARILFIVAVLFITPLAGTMGTDNPLSIQAILFLFSWSSLILVLLVLFSEITNNQAVSYIILLTVFVLASFQLYIGMVNHPYRISQSLRSLTKKLPNHNVYVDDKTYEFITRIEEELQGLKLEDNHPMLDINTLPGVVFLLNGKSPGTVWSRKNISTWQGKRLLESEMKGLQKTILFLPSNGISKNYASILNQKGIQYPQNYTTLREVKHPIYGYMISIMVPNQMLN